MGPRTRASAEHCLFCLKICDKPTSLINKEKGVFLGAVGCTSLQKQLQQYFVLRYLLEIPAEWCEQKLLEDGDSHPDPWFRLCDKCLKFVCDAWKIRQKILPLETQLNSVKQSIIEQIRKSIAVSKRKFKKKEMGVEDDIRSMLFPDLMADILSNNAASVEVIDVDELIEIDIDDENSNCYSDGNFEEFLIDDDMNVDVSISPKSKSSPCGRRRGRKPKLKGKKKRKPSIPSFHWRICQQCPARYSSAEEFESHMEAHEESKQTGGIYDCKECSFPARSTGELEVHVNHKHTNPKHRQRTYTCSHCDFKSGTWKNLKAHVWEKHPDLPKDQAIELELKCSECSKDFETRSTLILHQRKMHPELFGAKQEELQCSHCSMMFPDAIRLKFHVNSVHFRINRFICDECGKGFRFVKSLERHKITHDKGKREYICDICGCDYGYMSILTEHYKKFHPTVSKEGGKDDGGNDESTNQPMISCKYCDLQTPYKTVLIRHMQVHKAEMGFQCDICSKYYTSAQGLRRHKNINHPLTVNEVKCPYCFKSFPHVDYMKTHMRLYCKLKTLKDQEKSNDSPSEQHQLQQQQQSNAHQQPHLNSNISNRVRDSPSSSRLELEGNAKGQQNPYQIQGANPIPFSGHVELQTQMSQDIKMDIDKTNV